MKDTSTRRGGLRREDFALATARRATSDRRYVEAVSSRRGRPMIGPPMLQGAYLSIAEARTSEQFRERVIRFALWAGVRYGLRDRHRRPVPDAYPVPRRSQRVAGVFRSARRFRAVADRPRHAALQARIVADRLGPGHLRVSRARRQVGSTGPLRLQDRRRARLAPARRPSLFHRRGSRPTPAGQRQGADPHRRRPATLRRARAGRGVPHLLRSRDSQILDKPSLDAARASKHCGGRWTESWLGKSPTRSTFQNGRQCSI